MEVGKYEDGTPACLGDTVIYNESEWFIVYRYGRIGLKQIGMMAIICLDGFDKGDLSRVEKTNIFGAGKDWLIIGFTDEPMYDRLIDIGETK